VREFAKEPKWVVRMCPFHVFSETVFPLEVFVANLIDMDLPQVSFFIELRAVILDVDVEVTVAALDSQNGELVHVLLRGDPAVETLKNVVRACRDQRRVLRTA
jgi:hypothetical protein